MGTDGEGRASRRQARAGPGAQQARAGSGAIQQMGRAVSRRTAGPDSAARVTSQEGWAGQEGECGAAGIESEARSDRTQVSRSTGQTGGDLCRQQRQRGEAGLEGAFACAAAQPGVRTPSFSSRHRQKPGGRRKGQTSRRNSTFLNTRDTSQLFFLSLLYHSPSG